ncbi:hypothetical protein D3C87_715930 [compost metagenome]
MNVPFAGPFSFPLVPAIIDTVAASLSVIVAVAVALLITTIPPVMTLNVAVKVSEISAMLSLLIGTVKLNTVPAAALAGKFNVPLVAV